MQPTPQTTTVDASTNAWSARINDNFTELADFIATFDLAVSAEGDTATASRVHIQRQNARATPSNEAAMVLLRVRVLDDDGAGDPDHATLATTATIAAAGSTTLVETIAAGTDLVLQSDAAGLVELDLSDAVEETVHVAIGAAPVGAPLADYRPTLSVTHAAP